MSGLTILLKKNARIILNVRLLARDQSLFKAAFILFFAASMLVGLWALFYEGFSFLDTLGGVGLVLIPRLFSLFFFGLLVMLILSSTVTAYTTFYRSEDLPFLLLKPLKMSDIIYHKYLEATLYSSWAFFFVIVPFVGAYAFHEKLSLLFSLWTLLFSLPFILLCAGIGALVTMMAIRWLPHGRWLFIFLGAGILAWVLWMISEYGGHVRVGEESTLILSSLIPGLRVSSHPLWPSWWVAEGIMAMSREQWGRGGMLLGVLVANMLVVLLLIEIVGRAWFYEGWQRVLHSAVITNRRGVLLGGLERMLSVFPLDVRALVMKDIRVFLREPAQWSQGLLFFGLLGIYFLNLRNLNYHQLPVEWRNLIAFLNVFSVSAVLSSLGCRFVYPQLSLEGHSFWILGLSPVSMGRILMTKFGLALTGMMTVSFGLMLLCVRMLNVQPVAQWISLALAGCVSLAVAGLSTGLGAVFIDLKQRNPSAIVSGFGGTLDLALSLAYIMVTMLPVAVLFHLHNTQRLSDVWFGRSLVGVIAWLVLVTLAAVIAPLAAGLHALKKMEY